MQQSKSLGQRTLKEKSMELKTGSKFSGGDESKDDVTSFKVYVEKSPGAVTYTCKYLPTGLTLEIVTDVILAPPSIRILSAVSCGDEGIPLVSPGNG